MKQLPFLAHTVTLQILAGKPVTSAEDYGGAKVAEFPATTRLTVKFLIMKKKLSFREMAVGELRQHRWCGDAFPENGWPSVNKVLAQYALEKRAVKLNKTSRAVAGIRAIAKQRIENERKQRKLF